MKIKQTILKTLFRLLCSVLLLFTGRPEFHFDLFAKGGELEIDSVDNNIIRANTKFGFNLFNEIRRTEGDKNLFISPLSTSLVVDTKMRIGFTGPLFY